MNEYIMGIISVVFFSFGMALILYPYFRRQKYLQKFPMLVRADETCKGPHKWDKGYIAIKELPPDSYTVCTECGYVSGSEYKLNGPGIEVYRNNIRLRMEEIRLKELVGRIRQSKLDELMHKLVKGVILDFEGDVQENAAKLQQFFRKSAMEFESLPHEVQAELQKEVSKK